MVTSAKPRRTAAFYAGASYVAGDSVGYLLNQVVISMRRQIEQAMTAHDLTAAQWYPLWRLKLGHAGTARGDGEAGLNGYAKHGPRVDDAKRCVMDAHTPSRCMGTILLQIICPFVPRPTHFRSLPVPYHDAAMTAIPLTQTVFVCFKNIFLDKMAFNT